MVASRRLGAQLGIPEDVLREIDNMHEQNDKLILELIGAKTPISTAYEILTSADFDLQLMWGFPLDISKHTLVKQYRFKKKWIDRKFKCLDTGVEFIIPHDVVEGKFYDIGHGGIDVGRLDAYYRIIGNVVEVK